MEKGNSKSSSSKSTSSDPKNKQESVNKHLRLPRNKDNASPRSDTRRKSNPQKTREFFDKRPRNKTGAICERYRSEVTEDFPITSQNKQGSRKTDLNHLLNFTLAPLDKWNGHERRHVFNKTKLPKYNKELFLQANCQFVARSSGDYSVCKVNPDILVEWSLIEEVRLFCHDIPMCPICLCVPVAAKITRCGHIYCWPCMLHYLALTDNTWHKCPICFEAVHKTDLKSVSMHVKKCFAVGDEITLCLMKREKGSLLSVPISYPTLDLSLCNVLEDECVTRYQKLLLASPQDVEVILKRERNELTFAYEEEKDSPEACFIESALKLLFERENEVLSNQKCFFEENLNLIKKHQPIQSMDGRNWEMNNNAMTINPSFNGNPQNFSSEFLPYKSDSLNTPNVSKGVSFCYQAEDGQHIYIHNINIRMLTKEYGSLELAPIFVTAKIVEMEHVTMTEVLRKRLRYLQHLPLTCEFQIVELDFGQIIPKPTLSLFNDELWRRQVTRNKKARDERRRERKIEEEENIKLGKYPKPTFNLNSADQFPAYNPEDFVSLSPPKDEDFLAIQKQLGEDNRDSELEHLDSNVSAGSPSIPVTSFAQMLKDGPQSFKCAPRPIQPRVMSPHRQPQMKGDTDDDECTPPPEYRQSFSDAIQAALDSITLNEPSENNPNSRKKKKGKKQVLFTTSMCRTK